MTVTKIVKSHSSVKDISISIFGAASKKIRAMSETLKNRVKHRLYAQIPEWPAPNKLTPKSLSGKKSYDVKYDEKLEFEKKFPGYDIKSTKTFDIEESNEEDTIESAYEAVVEEYTHKDDIVEYAESIHVKEYKYGRKRLYVIGMRDVEDRAMIVLSRSLEFGTASTKITPVPHWRPVWSEFISNINNTTKNIHRSVFKEFKNELE